MTSRPVFLAVLLSAIVFNSLSAQGGYGGAVEVMGDEVIVLKPSYGAEFASLASAPNGPFGSAMPQHPALIATTIPDEPDDPHDGPRLARIYPQSFLPQILKIN